MNNDWDRYQKFVLDTLGRHEKRHESLEKKIELGFEKIMTELTKQKISIAIHKIKASAWGFLGGASGVIIMKVVEKWIG